MRISVCIDAVFNDLDFIESMGKVKEAGIDAYEFWGWWDKDISAIAEEKKKLNMETAAMCTKFVSLVDPSQLKNYITGLKESIEAARQLECKTLISQVGKELPGIPRETQHKNLVDGLKECAGILEKENITLVIEPLNILVNHKGYYLWSSDEAFQIEEEVGSSHVKILYDIYHQQIMEGNLISRIQKNIGKIGHFHAAGNPGRHELTSGEINYIEVLKAIEASGYSGYVGLEYFPVLDPVEGLKKLMEAI